MNSSPPPLQLNHGIVKPGKHFLALLILVQIGFSIPILLEEYVLAIVLLFGILALFFVYNHPTNGLILLPLFLYLPFSIPGLGGIQFSEIGTFFVILSLIFALVATRSNFEFEAPALLPLAFILVAAVLSVINARYVFASVKNILKFVEAFLLIFWLTATFVTKKETILKIFNSFLVAGVVAAVIGIYRYMEGYETRVFGLQGGGFGAYIGVSSLIALDILILAKANVKKLLALLVLILFIAALILSQTRAWLLATILAMLFMITRIGSKKKSLGFAVMIMVLVTVVYVALSSDFFPTNQQQLISAGAEKALQTGFGPEDTVGKYVSILMRVFIWIHGFSLYMQNPVLGFGIGNLRFKNFFTGELGPPSDPNVGYVDNHWLNVLYETGVLGIIGWVALAALVFKCCKTIIKSSTSPEWKLITLPLAGSMIIFLVGSIFWALTVVHEMTVLIPFLMGLIFASMKILQNQDENPLRQR
ncbi:MAG: O-antigen ligase family protein [bacterium]